MAEGQKFTIGYYLSTVTRMLGEPGRFFGQVSDEPVLGQALGFLIVSSLFFAGASLINTLPARPVLWGCIFFANATGMTFIGAGLGYLTMAMCMGKKVGFVRFFNVYALSAGVTLLASWVPFFVWLTEPWKWWLIGTGMVKACDLKPGQAFLIIGVSVGIMMLFFWSAGPVIAMLRS